MMRRRRGTARAFEHSRPPPEKLYLYILQASRTSEHLRRPVCKRRKRSYENDALAYKLLRQYRVPLLYNCAVLENYVLGSSLYKPPPRSVHRLLQARRRLYRLSVITG